MACLFCGRWNNKDEINDEGNHNACSALHDQRERNKICTKCGINDAMPDKNIIACSDCYVNKKEFVGYGSS